MGEKRGIKGLELWCRRVTEGYPGVKIENMTTSWRDGLAFCAIIHHFRPDLINFSKLNKEDIYLNNDLAFTVAEKYLGIPALLEPDDMVEYAVPDRLSILTYLSQFYRVFVGSQGTPSRIVPKRPPSSAERGLVSPESTSPPSKVAVKSPSMPHRDPCAKCSLPVFIAERLNVGKLLYHRTCFRCARCNSQLTLANYYETETKNQFCCETCPDEETKHKLDTQLSISKSIIVRSLSDEEKTNFKTLNDEDDYSAEFEIALEDPNLSKTSSLSSVKNSEYLTARTQFFNSQIENSENNEEAPPELPKSKPPDIINDKSHLENFERSENVIPSYFNNVYTLRNKKSESVTDVDSDVNSSDRTNISEQLNSAHLMSGRNNENMTKEPSANKESPSLVKTRMRLFEENNTKTSPPLAHKNKELEKETFEFLTANENVIRDNIKSPSDGKDANKAKQLPKFESNQVPDIVRDTSIPQKTENKGTSKKLPFLEKQKPNNFKSSITNDKKETSSLNNNKKVLGEMSNNNRGTSSKTPKSEKGNIHINNVTLREKNVRPQSNVMEEEYRKTGVSALKNLFENSLDIQQHSNDHSFYDCKSEIGQNQTKDIITSTDTKNFSETSGTSVDETISNEEKLENKPLEFDESMQENEFVGNVITTNIEKDLAPLLQTVHTGELKTKDLVDEVTYDSNVPSPSKNSEEFVELIKIRSDINDITHSKKYEAKEENISHSDSQEAIINISDNSNDTIATQLPYSVIEISDSVIEISDSVIEISDSVIEISDSSADMLPVKSTNSINIEEPTALIHPKISANVENELNTSIKLNEDEYPENLNPFSDDDNDVNEEKKVKVAKNLNSMSFTKTLNPFDEDDEEEEMKPNPIVIEETIENLPVPTKRKIKCDFKLKFDSPDLPEHLQKIYMQRISDSNFVNINSSPINSNADCLNPFEGDSDDNLKTEIPTPKKRTKIKFESTRAEKSEYENQHEVKKLTVIPAPKISFNPFWSDEENDSEEVLSDTENRKRSEESMNLNRPRKSYGNTANSNTSLSSGSSSGQKKKHLAPKPPSIATEKAESSHSSLTSSPATSVQHSPRSTPKARKNKKAPLPPHSSPFLTAPNINEPFANLSPIDTVSGENETNTANLETSTESENVKNVKDEFNRNRQTQCFSPFDDKDYLIYPANKSTYGKWKRRKGPAPSRPIPQRRTIKSLPMTEVRRELDLIELQQQGLEKQGVRLEHIIRDRCEGPNSVQEDSVPIDVEDLILQLFEVVNEKNELCRRQAELMYLQRQHRLEEEHADVEYQIRCLMLQPEANKTDSDKAKEEELINRLVEIVERRNEIIECLEMDRIREAEEDSSISNSMNSYASKRDEVKINPQEGSVPKKSKKKIKKDGKVKMKNTPIDMDKDLDESENINSLSKKQKEKKKKKFAIF